MSLGPMSYLAPKGYGEKSMTGTRRPGPGIRDGAPGDPRDMVKAKLPEAEISRGATARPPERYPEPVPHPAPISHSVGALSGCGAMSSEDIEGDEWAA